MPVFRRRALILQLLSLPHSATAEPELGLRAAWVVARAVAVRPLAATLVWAAGTWARRSGCWLVGQ